MEMQGYDAIIIFIIILGVLIFIGVVVSYILFSIGLANLARREAIKKAHLAFIPIVQLYIVGEILADNNFSKEWKTFSNNRISSSICLSRNGCLWNFIATIRNDRLIF